MANLGPQHINQSFGDLLQLPNGLTPAIQNVQDGSGNVTPLEISTTAVDLPIVGPDGSGMLSDLGGASGSSFVGFEQTGAGAVLRTSESKLSEWLSVFDFGATGDGSDQTSYIQAAITAAYAQEKALYFPAGTYLISSTITMGNTTTNAAKFCYFFGDGRDSIIRVTAANVNPFLWQGPNPNVDGAGNRIDGRILLENLSFVGPSSFGSNTNSIGVKFYGAQGIKIKGCYFSGWYDGEHYQNCDIVTRVDVYSQSNYNGVNSSASGYAIAGEGQLNSFNNYGGLIANNAQWGIQYVGGLAPCFFGVNFAANGASLIFSPNNISGPTTTQFPTIHGCYFEGDTGTTILLGGGNGIVRGISVEGGFMIAAAATALITVANYSNSLGRGFIRIGMDISASGASAITQTSSAEKVDFALVSGTSFNGMTTGDVTPAPGTFTTLTANSTLIANQGIAFAAGQGIDASNGVLMTGSTGTFDFPNFSGFIIANAHTTGGSNIFLCGAAIVTTVATNGGGAGTLSYVAGINGYRLTESTGTTQLYGITFIKTRPAA